ncbi:MAG: outer membrane protein assembly factor, partial [Sulfurovum sp.]
MPYIFIFFILLLPIDFAQAKQEPLPSHNITIEGQKHISTDALYHALGVETKSIFAFWKKDTPKINDKLLPTLKESLQNFYESEGFYDATFHIVKTNTTIDIHIKENQPIRVSNIHKVNDYPIASLIELKKGDIFKAQKFIDTKNAIIEALLDEGYCSYDLDTKAYVDL